MAADNVVFLTVFLKPELKLEVVLAFKTIKISRIQLQFC